MSATFTETDHCFMRRALVLAERAERLGEVPVGAVLVKNREIIGEGFNHPIAMHDPTAHAEIMAIRHGCLTQQNYRLPDTTLYVTLEPCSMCAGAIVHARISRVIFATHEPKAGAVESTQSFFQQAQLNHRVIHRSGLLKERASEQLSQFFKRRRAEKKRNTH